MYFVCFVLIVSLGVVQPFLKGELTADFSHWAVIVPCAALFLALLSVRQHIRLDDDGVHIVIAGFTVRRLTWDSFDTVTPTKVRLLSHGAGIRMYGGGKIGFIMSGGAGVTLTQSGRRASTVISVGEETERDRLIAELVARGVSPPSRPQR